MVKFVIGTLSLPPSDLEALMTEEHTHQDLLLLSTLKESYHNLTRKGIHSETPSSLLSVLNLLNST